MVVKIEKSAKSRDEAVLLAMRELWEINPDINENDVEIELLEKGKSGFFGLGSVDAKVSVSYKYKPEESVKVFLEGLISHMGVNGCVDCTVDEDGTVNADITGDNLGVVIGRRGDTLNALQYLTSIVINRGEENHVRVNVDTENYRAKREESLKTLAHKVASRVLKYKKNVTLEPMNANERRVIHAELQGVRGITTYSLGSEPNRRVVVAMAGSRPGKNRSRNSDRPVDPPKSASIPQAGE